MKMRTYLHRSLAFLVCVVMACSLMPATAFAIKGPDPSSWGAPHISDLYIEETGGGHARLVFYLEQSPGALDAWTWYMENGAAEGFIVGMINGIWAEYSVNGGAWTEYDMVYDGIDAPGEMLVEGECYTSVLESYEELASADVRLRVYYNGFYVDDNNKMIGFRGSDYGMYSNELTAGITTDTGDTGDTAEPEVPESTPVFSDVPANAWYAHYVELLADAGLLKGKGEGIFAPADNMTVAEAITLAVRLDALVKEIPGDPAQLYPVSGPWYQPYVEYTKENGLPWQYGDYNIKITRSEFAHIFAAYYKNNKALYDEGGVVPKNEVRDGAIPDVPMTYQYADDVYTLYRLGVLTGSDAAHSFRPESNIQRCEVAAIVARLGEPDYLQSFTLK